MKKRSAQKPGTTTLRKFVFGHSVSLGLGVLFAVIAYKAPRVMGLHSSSAKPGASVERRSTDSKPWGILETTPIQLDRPDEFYKQSGDTKPGQQIEWLFEQYSPDQLNAFIQSCELSTAEKSILLDRTRWRIGNNGILVNPPLEFVRDLKASARKQLYSVLAKSPLNVAQYYPLVYDLNGFERLLAVSGLPAPKLDLIRKLTYVKDGFRYFCDGQVFELLSSPDEARMLMQTLTRVPTLTVRLRVNPDSDIESLVRYWATPGQDAAVRRILTAMARTTQGDVLNISHFLPPVPRLQLYTFPSAQPEPGSKYPDCFWTAMNFFHDQPDSRLFDANYRATTLKTDYEQVPQPTAFGDLLLFYHDNAGQRKPVHMCNYIADDIVFTKNGTNYFAPWVLMRMPDMVSQYTSDQPLQMAVFRHKQQ